VEVRFVAGTPVITASAVLSAVAGLLSAWPVVVFLFQGLPAAGHAPVPNLRGLLIAVALFQLSFAVWGICNAVGLLRLGDPGAALAPRAPVVLVGTWCLILSNTRRMKDAFATSSRGSLS
jgi:hypothetical protein